MQNHTYLGEAATCPLLSLQYYYPIDNVNRTLWMEEKRCLCMTIDVYIRLQISFSIIIAGVTKIEWKTANYHRVCQARLKHTFSTNVNSLFKAKNCSRRDGHKPTLLRPKKRPFLRKMRGTFLNCSHSPEKMSLINLQKLSYLLLPAKIMVIF